MQNISHFSFDMRTTMFQFLSVLVLLMPFSFGQIARAAPPQYDGNMTNQCTPTGICSRQSIDKTFAAPRATFPIHGFMSATGSFMSPFGEFTIVNFDDDTITSITTFLNRSTNITTVTEKVSVKVAAKAAVTVKELAAELWNSKQSSPPPTDFCAGGDQNFVLFNGSHAAWYGGGCPPNGISEKMNEWAEQQLQPSAKP